MFILNLRFVLLLSSVIFLSACGGGRSDTTTNTNNNDATNPSKPTTAKTDAVVMVSSNPDLSSAQPLQGTTVEGNTHIFFVEGSDWSKRGVKRVDFYCCKNSSSPHTRYPSDTTATYSINLDLSSYQDGNYELYVDVFFEDQYEPVPFFVNFKINNASLPDVIPNSTPTISGNPAASVYVDSVYSFTPTADDGDGDGLTFKIVNMPSWASFDTSTGSLSGTPSTADVGTYSNIIISVTDSVDTVSLTPFSIEVMNVTPPANNAPSISGIPASSVYENDAYSFTPTASDADGDVLVFSILNMPSWASFNTSTGSLSGTPSTADVGTYSNIIISVTDSVDTVSLTPFSIEVKNVPAPINNAPTIIGIPAGSVYENDAYSFTPTASDADGDVLVFSILNMPSWASFNTSTGSLSGTPSTADVGTYSNIIISVTDSVDTVSLMAFSIEVMNVPQPINNAPTISGNPASSVYENDAYSFTPTASDADGDVLVFSILNMPSWASFSTSTGSLTGTPSNADIGIYNNIIISVTDGTDTTSLVSFNIEVTAQPIPTTGSATLTWTPPTTYTDNTPLTSLSGYKIYYGTTPGSYPNMIDIPNPGIATYLVDNLVGGKRYYFVITAYDANGVESAFSSSAFIDIP